MNRETTTSRPEAASPSAADAPDKRTIELLASWQHQDATDNPDELRTAENELAEFKKAMNENRTLSSEPVLYT